MLKKMILPLALMTLNAHGADLSAFKDSVEINNVHHSNGVMSIELIAKAEGTSKAWVGGNLQAMLRAKKKINTIIDEVGAQICTNGVLEKLEYYGESTCDELGGKENLNKCEKEVTLICDPLDVYTSEFTLAHDLGQLTTKEVCLDKLSTFETSVDEANELCEGIDNKVKLICSDLISEGGSVKTYNYQVCKHFENEFSLNALQAYINPYDRMHGFGVPGIQFAIMALEADTAAESECVIDELDSSTFTVKEVANKCIVGGSKRISIRQAKIEGRALVEETTGWFRGLFD